MFQDLPRFHKVSISDLFRLSLIVHPLSTEMRHLSWDIHVTYVTVFMVFQFNFMRAHIYNFVLCSVLETPTSLQSTPSQLACNAECLAPTFGSLG